MNGLKEKRHDRKLHHNERASKEEKKMLDQFKKHVNIWHSGGKGAISTPSNVHIVELTFDTAITPKELAFLLVKSIGERLNE